MKHHFRPPELKLTTILVGLAICLYGCSSSYTVSSAGKPNSEYTYREMNEELQGRDAKIELKDGRVMSAKEIKISDGSVSWVDRRTDEESKTSIREINKITIKRSSKGALEGFGFGVLIGGGLGAIILGSTDNGKLGSGAGVAIGLIVGGGAGIIGGLTTGLIVGHSDNYEFLPTAQSDSLQNGK